MKNVLAGASVLAFLGASAAVAGGIDRSGQPIDPLFAKGNYAEFSLGFVKPTLSGRDYAGGYTSNVAESYLVPSLAFKKDINSRLSYAVILDQAFGADILYGPNTPMFAGTKAKTTTTDLTGLIRYKLNDRFSIYGGIRAENADGNVALNGLAYGSLSGYSLSLASNTAAGYVVGAAYEIPEMALRLAVTYNSAISHKFGTVEQYKGATVGTSPTTVKTPQSVNVDFQTGLNPKTLLFGGIRWVNWSKFRIDPAWFTANSGSGLVSLEDTTTYRIGVGRKITDRFSALVSVQYEPAGNRLVSPLAPSTGKTGITVGSVYTQGNMKITTGVNYTWLGDAKPQTGGSARADFTGNHAWGLGMKVAWQF